jgi:S-DNA-T family DNA segregation ATPase FtsK/SpoIIIE
VRQRELLRGLLQAVADRVHGEETLAGDQASRLESEDGGYAAACEALEAKREDTRATVIRQYDLVRDENLSRIDAETAAIRIEYDDQVSVLQERVGLEQDRIDKRRDEDSWMVQAMLDDTAEDSPKHQFESFKARLKSNHQRRMADWDELSDRVEGVAVQLADWRLAQSPPTATGSRPPTDLDDCLDHFVDCVDRANRTIGWIGRLWLPRLLFGRRLLLVWLLSAIAIGVPLFLFDVPGSLGIIDASSPVAGLVERNLLFGICAGAGVIGSMCWVGLLLLVVRSRCRRLWERLCGHTADARRARQYWLKVSQDELDSRKLDYVGRQSPIVKQRADAIGRIDEHQSDRAEELANRHATELASVHTSFPERLKGLAADRVRQASECELEREARLEEIESEHRSVRDQLDREHGHRLAVDREHFQRSFAELSGAWESACVNFDTETRSMESRCDGLFLSWSELAAEGYQPPESVPEAVRLGKFEVNLSQVPGGVSEDSRLQAGTGLMSMPAILPFPDRVSLLLEADREGRDAAVGVLQTAILRLLTSVPAGKLRLTIIDPVGLGDNFSAFMHLADFDELLVSGRIWTESSQIDRQLANLTEHMENVFQTYLRNQFATIEEYNSYAGEVAEPYHVLVVASFPVNFSDNAVRRLLSIASSGARCGVYTLVSIDTRQQMPHNFDLEDLRAHANNLVWTGDTFSWRDPDMAWLPLSLERPPEPAEFVKIVRNVGEYARDTRRVEVPFERIAPDRSEYWSRDSRRSLDVPLGRAGATKLQDLHLGSGTSQHVLIAGKTGSGKSSFLHTLITNISLYYGPDQVEFYLIDFKKGVEFKTYVINELPHARVVAIESDREFGLSVLERLDGMLSERGDLFRKHHVQDVAGYRDACPDEPMPRVLLIIDEFQEFFVEDDRVHQQSSLLLDRLVRQGRAFGVHVLLGSQTIGGAYSLARSTLGQVAVRVALQCSESDAHLILSEENTAARLLTRPGEAIYNDANGLLEGNHPFQIAWLDEEARDLRLGELREKAVAEGWDRRGSAEPMVVFEGNKPADVTTSGPLAECLNRAGLGKSSRSPLAWVGESVQIKASPELRFRRQSGTNLILVGQQDEEARGVLEAVLLALAAQQGQGQGQGQGQAGRFVVCDGSASDEPHGESWQRVADLLPGEVELVRPRKVSDALESLAAEVSRRDREDDESAGSVFLVIHDLGRFRDIRRGDDDFGFGSSFGDESAVTPSQQLVSILRDGPALGVHTLCWCDSYNNLSRWLSTQTLREFEIRVVFQMSASDSSNLVDSAAASRLGSHRALLYLGEQGGLEKFRPFAPLPEEWLREVSVRLRGAATT